MPRDSEGSFSLVRWQVPSGGSRLGPLRKRSEFWRAIASDSDAGGFANQRGETNGKQNAHRERIWFSPYCLKPGLFSILSPEKSEIT